MEQIVRVRRLHPDGRAEVFLVRESACSGDCHKCSGCGAAKETMIVTAENPIKAEVGDFVTLSSDTASVMKAVVAVYLIPMVLFFAGFGLGMAKQWSPGHLFVT
jgi:sigma-E factor negative regulatory protein RseC